VVDTLRIIFLEEPVYLCVALGIVELLMLVVFLKRRTRRTGWALLPAAVLAASVLVLAALVETDREKIDTATHEIVAAFNAGRPEDAARYLDDEISVTFAGQRFTRETVIGHARRVMKNRKVTRVVLLQPLETNPDAGRADQSVKVKVAWGEGAQKQLFMKWKVQWIRRADGWRIIEAEHLRWGPTPILPG